MDRIDPRRCHASRCPAGRSDPAGPGGDKAGRGRAGSGPFESVGAGPDPHRRWRRRWRWRAPRGRQVRAPRASECRVADQGLRQRGIRVLGGGGACRRARVRRARIRPVQRVRVRASARAARRRPRRIRRCGRDVEAVGGGGSAMPLRLHDAASSRAIWTSQHGAERPQASTCKSVRLHGRFYCLSTAAAAVGASARSTARHAATSSGDRSRRCHRAACGMTSRSMSVAHRRSRCLDSSALLILSLQRYLTSSAPILAQRATRRYCSVDP